MKWSYSGVRAAGLVVPEDEAAVGAAEREMDVAGIALALVELGHERQRPAVLLGDFLGGVLVDGVVVGGGQHLVEPEGDLVLTEVALALRRFHGQPGRVHGVADVAQQRLDPGGAQDRVVDVVLIRRGQALVAGVPGLLVGVVEDDELQLGAGERGQPGGRRPARSAP